MVRLTLSPPRDPCDLGQIAARYCDLLELGRQLGIKPTFEYIGFFRSASRLSDAWRVVQQADDPDATLILDSFHSWNSGSTLDDLRANPANRISRSGRLTFPRDRAKLKPRRRLRFKLGETPFFEHVRFTSLGKPQGRKSTITQHRVSVGA